MNVLHTVKALNLPLGEYLVIGSGAMAVRGIREAKDIDLLVSHNLYTKLIDDGWDEREVHPGYKVIEKDRIEASPDIITLENYQPDTIALMREAETIEGVPFMSLEELKKFKQALGRDKDKADILLIDAYLAK